MPYKTETLTLEEELDALEDERADLLDEVADLDPENPEATRLQNRGERLDSHIAGIQWALSAHEDPAVGVWDEPAESITIGGLSGGEYGRVEDAIGSQASERGLQRTTGLARVYMVAFGTVDAPYLNDGADEDEQIAAVSQLPFQFLQFVESRVNELTTVDEGNGQSFAAAVAARRNETT